MASGYTERAAAFSTRPALIAPELAAAIAQLACAADTEVGETLVAQVAQLLAADDVRLALVGPNPDQWVLQHASGPASEHAGATHAWGAGLLGRVMLRGEAVMTADFATDPLAAEEPAPVPVGSLIAVPLRVHDLASGAILAARGPDLPALTALDAVTLQALADLAAARFSAAPAVLRLRARAQELAVMNPLWRPRPEQAGDFVVITPGINGRDRPFLDADDAACRILGYPREELLQRAIRDIIPLPPGAEHVDTLAAVRNQMERGVPVTYNTICRCRDGTLLPVRDTIQRVDVPDGFVYRTTFVDLSGEQEAQVRAIQTEKQRLLQEIGVRLAHKLNNPLSVISGNIEMALDEYQEPGLLELLQPVRSAAERVAATVRELGNFTTLTAAGGWASIDLNHLANQVVEEMRARWDGRPRPEGGATTLQLDTVPVASVRGSKAELEEALRELLTNAAQAMPQGGAITIRTGQSKDGVFLSVSDTGVGMNDEVRQRCVDPFFTTKGPAATGLGLNRVYHTVLRHHGHLQVESTIGRGSRMTIVLPLTLPDA
ncbi:MAG TPA: ATP-binding protein [Chloroflexota bacterium]|nr:ATP-binding protein [Chloroflexota bacterium]